MAYSTKEHNRRVLVLDDEIDVLEFLRIFLSSLSWEVTTASTADAAFAALEKDPHFLIISDIAMPRMDGYEFMTEVLERHIPSRLAFMTGFGYDPNHTLVKIRKDHRYPCLFKPFNRDKVAEVVAAAFEAYEQDVTGTRAE